MGLKDFQLEGKRWVYHKGMTSITRVAHYFNVNVLCGSHYKGVHGKSHYMCAHNIYQDKCTPFMVFSITHIICKGSKLDAQRSQSVMPANCQYDSIRHRK
jgi:hypothetical protein